MTIFAVDYQVMNGDVGLIINKTTHVDIDRYGDIWMQINGELHKTQRRCKILFYAMNDESDFVADYFC